jgi:hypothetical protein
LTTNEVEDILKIVLSSMKTEASVQAMLVLIPDSYGGLHVIANGLYSPSPYIRSLTVNILIKVESYPSTKPAFDALNNMTIAAFNRVLSKMKDGSITIETLRYKNKKIMNVKTPTFMESSLKMFTNTLTTEIVGNEQSNHKKSPSDHNENYIDTFEMFH